jgi:sulfite reductase alpha subunit-like flavoprotein
VRDIFCWALDITSPPKKSLLRALGDSAGDAGERAALYHLASRSGAPAYKAFVEAQWLTLHDLLAFFPSAQPTLEALISALNSLPPRLYSLTTSPLCTPSTLGIAFNVSEYTSSSSVGGGGGA